MENVLNRMPWAGKNARELEPLLTREWLVTNGLGGYASGTVAGVATRRFHGLLVAALSGPLGRVMMLNHLSEQLRLPDGTTVLLGGEERAHGRDEGGRMKDEPDLSDSSFIPHPSSLLSVPGAGYLTEFRLEAGLPVFCYHVAGYRIEKRLHLPHMQNTVYITYRVLEGDGTLRLKLRPSVHFRPHEAPVNTALGGPYVLTAVEDCYEIADWGLRIADSKTADLSSNPQSAIRNPQGEMPPLRLKLEGERSAFTVDGRRIPSLLYRIEESRGYESTGDLWSPGHFRVDLRNGGPATLIASTESWETIRALPPEEALQMERERRRLLLHQAREVVRWWGGEVVQNEPASTISPPHHPATAQAAELVLAADQFLITPAGRVEEAARARAAGDEVRTVIAGYHWFTDWGRDTMISLDGLTLVTGRHLEAGYILRTFAHYVRDGLIPNLFPEGEKEGLYHTADATLWFFHALARYLEVTGDRMTLRQVLPRLLDIVAHHLAGTRFHIGVDPTDGLLRQGQEGYQLTWMDAKVGDWVVTPRRGKAVEINALWYNALRLLERWAREEPDAAVPTQSVGTRVIPGTRVRGPGSGVRSQGPGGGSVPTPDPGALTPERLAGHAERAYRSFNERFWNPERGYLYDVVDGPDGDDPACRPNQVFAMSCTYPVLSPGRWKPVLEVVREKLLTPVGLRSLSPDHPDYKPRYDGDLRARDAAYHQGTVWAWLIGPFLDAWLKVHPNDLKTAAHFLAGFKAHLGEACLGTVSEIFDAEPPFTPRGCAAQAWSVAEVLRSWVRLARDGVRP